MILHHCVLLDDYLVLHTYGETSTNMIWLFPPNIVLLIAKKIVIDLLIA